MRGEIPHGVGNRRDFYRSVVAALITPLRLTKMVTPDGAELVSPEEHRARFEQADDASALAAREVAAWGPFDEGSRVVISLQAELRGRDACLLYPALLSASVPLAVRVDRLVLAMDPSYPETRVDATWRGRSCTCYLPDDSPDVVVFVDTPVLSAGGAPGDLVLRVSAIASPDDSSASPSPVSLSLFVLATPSSRRAPTPSSGG